MAPRFRGRIGLLPLLTAAVHRLLALLVIGAVAGYAIDGHAFTLEGRVKAAFLYKFAGYVEWPAQAFNRPDAPVVIGVVGADQLAEELEQMVVRRRVGDRPLAVRRLDLSDSLAGVHILFVGRDVDRAQARQVLARAHGEPVLTVTETDSAWPAGSIINFIVEENKVRFQISTAAAEDNGLRLGSQLLAVAREVRRSAQ